MVILKLYNFGIVIDRSITVNIYLKRRGVMYILVNIWGPLNIFVYTMLVYINLVPHISVNFNICTLLYYKNFYIASSSDTLLILQ